MDIEERNELIKEGESYCDQASISVNHSDYEQAHKLYDKAQDLFEQLNELPWLVFLLHEKFHLYHRMEKFDEALKLVDTIIKRYRETDNKKGLCLFMTHKASLHLDQANIHLSLECLKIAEVISHDEKLHETKQFRINFLFLPYNAKKNVTNKPL